MKKGHHLEFACLDCKKPVQFSLFEIDNEQNIVCCSSCEKKYFFADTVLKRQLKKFESLCRQIVESEEILGNTSVGIDVGEHKVLVPYKILLTRFSSSLELQLGSQKVNILFRLEPLTDLQIKGGDGVYESA